jgi:hypothetical protein
MIYFNENQFLFNLNVYKINSETKKKYLNCKQELTFY